MKIILLPFEVESYANAVLYKKFYEDGHEPLIVNCDSWIYNDYHGRKALKFYKDLGVINHLTLENIHKNFLQNEYKNKIDYKYLEYFEKEFCKSKNIIQLILTDHIFGHGFRYPYYINFTRDQKIKWVELQLKWIEGIVEQFSPDLIFTMERNYFVKNVFWQIAQTKNIKMLTLVAGKIQSKLYLSENFGYGSSPKFDAILNSYNSKQLIEAKEYVDHYYKSKEFSTYNSSFTEKLYKDNSIRFTNIIKEFLNSVRFEIKHLIISRKKVKEKFHPVLGEYSEFKALIYHLRRLFNKIRYKCFRKIDFVQDLPATPFIYFALHALPESSTLTLSKEYYEEDIIRSVSKELPIGMTLLVKENPLMVGDRPYSFYKQLKENINVKLIDPFFLSKEIVKKTLGTVGISGNVLLETALLNKPTLAFGEPEFINIIPYKGQKDINAFIKDCSEKTQSVKFQNTLCYVQYVIDNGEVLPWLDILYKRRSNTFTVSVNKLYELIKEHITNNPTHYSKISDQLQFKKIS